jgi:hypothetical protein
MKHICEHPNKYYVWCSISDSVIIFSLSLLAWEMGLTDSLLFMYHYARLNTETQRIVWPAFAETKDRLLRSSLTLAEKQHKISMLRMFGYVI